MIETRRNPFPGLRPFLFHEHELFFGREEQYEQMVGKLATTRFLAVVGTSGSGKSSLVRAGLLPALYGGQMMSAGSNWRVALFRPKDDPIRELAQALNHRRVFGAELKDDGSPLLSVGDVIDWPALCFRLSDDARKSPPNPSSRILELLPQEMRQNILDTTQKEDFEQVYKSHFVEAFNNILTQREFYLPQVFEKIPVTGEAKRLMSLGQENLSDAEIQKLNRLLLEASYPQEIAKDREIQTRITEVSLRRGDLGLIETVRQANMPLGANLLVVVDQFEELFRYARISENGPHGNQAAAFVKLLLEAKSQKEIPIYVVLTMRSDYLGDCAKFWDLPEAINEGQYLTPRLTRDQRREAIVGPIKARNADITPQLVNQLLNDMGDSPDQLPILQHSLMRTWDRWEDDHQENEPIGMRHYDAIGRMVKALSLHADEAYDELPDDRSREIARQVFKCLTERGSRNREIRRPTALKEIRAITRAKVKEIVAVIDVFRKEGRSFLMPSPKKPLTRNTSIDISHESLIRNWVRLKDWVQEEARAANAYRRLAETAQLNKTGKASWLSDLEVEYALEWRKQNSPNQAWASRYHPYLNEGFQKISADGKVDGNKKLLDEDIFKSAISFLEESQQKCEQKRKDKERQDRAQLKRTRIVAATLLVLTLTCLGASFLTWSYWREAAVNEQLTNLLTYAVNINNAQQAFADNNFATAYSYLDILRDRQYEDMHGLEWDLLTKSCPQELVRSSGNKRIEMRHPTAVQSVAFLPDKNTLVTADAAGAVKFWDRNTQEEKPNPHPAPSPGSASKITFSTDGRLLAMVADNKIKRLDIATFQGWELPLPKKDPKDALIVQFVAFSPDGTKLIGVLAEPKKNDGKGFDPTAVEQIAVWDTNTDAGPQTLSIPRSSPGTSFTSVALSGNNEKLALGYSDGSVNLCNLTSPALKCPELPSVGDIIDRHTSKAFAEGEANKTKNSVQALTFAPDHKTLAVAKQSGFITLLDTDNVNSSPRRVGKGDAISALAFSSDGNIFAASSHQGSVELWYTDASKIQEGLRPINETGLYAVLKGHAGAVLSMAFLPDSKILATTSDDKTVRLWDTDQQEVLDKKLNTQVANMIDLSPGSNGESFAIQFTDGTLGFERRTREGFVSFSERFQAPPEDFQNVASIAFSVSDKRAVKRILSVYHKEGGRERVKLWNMDTLTPLPGEGWTEPVLQAPATYEPGAQGTRLISASRFSPDGKRLATWSPAAGLIFFNVETGQRSEPLLKPLSDKNFENFQAAAFSPDLNVFVESHNKTLSFFDARTGRLIKSETYEADPVNSMGFSQDGERFATGHADNTLRLWVTATWKAGNETWTAYPLKGHTTLVQVIAFSPDGKRLVTGSSDGVIKLWDIGVEHWNNNERLEKQLKRRELVSLSGNNSGVMALAFSSGGKTLVSGHANGMIRIVGAN